MDGPHPVLVFDGDCAFCTATVDQLRRFVRPRATIVPWQRTDLDLLGLTADQCRRSIQWVPAGSPIAAGGAAAAAVLCTGRQPWPLVGRAMQLPLINVLVEAVYRIVAANRYRLPGSTPACRLPDPAEAEPPASGLPASR